MIDLILRFPDEATAAGKLATYRRDGQWLLASHSHALDVIGPVVIVQAVYANDNGSLISPPVIDDRFHVNLRVLAGNAPAGLGPYTVAPSSPARVWS